MSDDEKVIALLKDHGAPALGEEMTRRIALRATEEFTRSHPRHAGAAPRGSFSLPAFLRRPGFAAAAIALAVVCFIGTRVQLPITPIAPRTAAETPLDKERQLLAQVNEVFGDRLQAVIRENGHTQIVLSDKDEKRGQPVVVRLTGKDGEIDIMSFSGENLKVSVNGRQVSFDALADGKGGVILAGDKLFWDGGKAKAEAAPDIKIEAKTFDKDL